jgi:alcohol dehydrogenase (NADP+)
LTDSCRSVQEEPCERCFEGQENYCPKARWTYPGPHHNGDKGYGGYATHHRCPGRFAFKIPDALESTQAATLLCAGITMYAPLKHNGCGPGKKIGLVGLGGLGHYGVLLAKAMGADQVIAISRKDSKRAEALALGADDYLATEDDPKWDRKYRKSLDLVIATVASAKVSQPMGAFFAFRITIPRRPKSLCTNISQKAPTGSYMKLLKYRGALVQVGNPDDGKFIVPPNPMLANKLSFSGSVIGSAEETRELLQLAADKGIRAWIQERPMRSANQALLDIKAGKPRYRYCLVNDLARPAL